MRKRSAQKGLHAIFTEQETPETRRGLELISISGMAAGTGVVLFTLVQFVGVDDLSVSAESFPTVLLLISLGFLMIMVGSVSYVYDLLVRRISEEGSLGDSSSSSFSTYKAGSISLEKRASDNDSTTAKARGDSMPQLYPRRGQRRDRSSSARIAIIEAFMLVILGIWLVSEYRSNPFMREWLVSNVSLLTTYVSPGLAAGFVGAFSILGLNFVVRGRSGGSRARTRRLIED